MAAALAILASGSLTVLSFLVLTVVLLLVAATVGHGRHTSADKPRIAFHEPRGRGMERIGIEPMTSALQRRRSPS